MFCGLVGTEHLLLIFVYGELFKDRHIREREREKEKASTEDFLGYSEY